MEVVCSLAVDQRLPTKYCSFECRAQRVVIFLSPQGSVVVGGGEIGMINKLLTLQSQLRIRSLR